MWACLRLAVIAAAPLLAASAAVPVAVAPGPGALRRVTASRAEVDAHFRAANRTGDGRLTWKQARNADWPWAVNHFAEIDAAGRGWISLAQIHAFERSRRRR